MKDRGAEAFGKRSLEKKAGNFLAIGAPKEAERSL